MTLMVFHPVVGGTEISARELACALTRRGHQVEVVTLHVRGLPVREVIGGVLVHRRLYGFGRGMLFVISYTVSLTYFLMRHRKTFDVIQVYYAYLDAVVCSILRKTFKNQAVIVRLGGGGAVGDLSRLRRLRVDRLFLPMIRRLDQFIVMSRQMRDELVAFEFDESKIALIPNGVDVGRFCPSTREVQGTCHLEDVRGTPRVVCVARLSPEKGLDVLFLAWRTVIARLPGALLICAGTGPQQAMLQRQVQELELNQSILFAGEVPDVRPLLEASDIFVLPSLSEGMPNALLQAMAMGLPCVATRIGGIPDLIEDGVNGRLVAAGNQSELAEVLLGLLTDQDSAKHLGVAARQTVQQWYSLERMVDRYEQCYYGLRGGRPALIGHSN